MLRAMRVTADGVCLGRRRIQRGDTAD